MDVRRAGLAISAAGGALLAAAVRGVAAARPAAKPLHPRGELVHGTVRRAGSVPRTGVPWFDEPGTDEVLVRLSRAVGLPAGLPDIHGLALRVPVPVERGRRPASGERHGDLLLAHTGAGQLGRFVLTAASRVEQRPLTTLLPYRTPSGPRLVAAHPTGPRTFELAHASPRGAWQRFGVLELSDVPGEDPLVSFDPLLNELPSLTNYGWVRRLREPGYRTARLSRRGRPAGPAT